MSTQVACLVEVTVSPDRLEARVQPGSETDPGQITFPAVIEALGAAKIEVTDSVREQSEAFVVRCQAAGGIEEPFLVARGTPAVEGCNGQFEPLDDDNDDDDDDTPPGSEEDRIDYRSLNTICTVEKGAVIGRCIPAVPGTLGRDVRGQTIQPRRRVQDVKLGPNVELSTDDPTQALAQESGTIVYRMGKLDIDDVINIKGDVDFETGNIDAASHVHIRGTVLDLFLVKARKSINIGGAVEEAQIQAGEDLIVRGGIAGRNKARIIAAGSVMARFCNEAVLQSGGDITLAKEAIHSHLKCGGKIVIEHGVMVGGEAFARNGGELGSLGNDADVPTVITLGTDPDVLRKVRQIDQGMETITEAVEQIRAKVKPLMANLRRLTPAQKEQATELLFKADEMELEIEQQREEQKAMLEKGRPADPPCLVVHSAIHPGVVIAIEAHQTRFTRELKGPVRIERRKVKSFTELVAVNLLTGTVTRLPTMAVDLSPRSDDASAPGTT